MSFSLSRSNKGAVGNSVTTILHNNYSEKPLTPKSSQPEAVVQVCPEIQRKEMFDISQLVFSVSEFPIIFFSQQHPEGHSKRRGDSRQQLPDKVPEEFLFDFLHVKQQISSVGPTRQPRPVSKEGGH